MTIVVGLRARGETQGRETATCPRRAPSGGVPLEALDRDDTEPPAPADPSPELAEGVAVPDDPALPELEPEVPAGAVGADGVEDVAGGVGTAGVVTVAVVSVGDVSVGVVIVGVVIVGVVIVGTVTVVRVGSVGGSRASAGPTRVAVVATATAQHTIDRALSIRLYNPHRRPSVTLCRRQKSANCNFFAEPHEAV